MGQVSRGGWEKRTPICKAETDSGENRGRESPDAFASLMRATWSETDRSERKRGVGRAG